MTKILVISSKPLYAIPTDTKFTCTFDVDDGGNGDDGDDNDGDDDKHTGNDGDDGDDGDDDDSNLMMMTKICDDMC
jgi:hypothetical protein